MLIGEYAHTLDQKGRVNFPAKLLTDLGDHFILSKGLDGCLFVYSMEEWGKPGEKNKRASSFQIADIAAVFLCRSSGRGSGQTRAYCHSGKIAGACAWKRNHDHRRIQPGRNLG